MSKRHQASRRRTFSRRQHEVNEIRERGRQDGLLCWLDETDQIVAADRWGAETFTRAAGDLAFLRGTN